MANYEYQALTPDGKRKKGNLEADSPRQVRQQLRQQDLMPIDVKSIDRKKRDLLHTPILTAQKISANDLMLMTHQLHTLLKSGMPLAESLNAVAQQTNGKRLQRFLFGLHTKVLEGHTFAQALRTSHYQVSEEFIATVSAGEQSGHLVAVLSQLGEAIRRQEKLRKKIQTAMIYPIIMLVMSFFIVLFLLVYVVPKIVTVFTQMKQTLPPLTQGLLDTSDFLQAHWLTLLIATLLLFGLYRFAMKYDIWHSRRDALLLRIPFLNRFLVFATCARWARTLGVLLSSGVAVTDALRISTEVITLMPLKQKALAMVGNVREGSQLQTAMQQAGFFPPLLMNLVQTGEGSGQLDKMLMDGAEHYETEVENASSTLISLVEPLMILVMGGIVLTIVLAIMLPIFNMNQMVH